MSGDQQETPVAGAGDPPPPKADMREFRLRPERPRVTRLSRKVLIGAGAVGSAAVFGATIWALQTRHQAGLAPELLSTTHKTQADGLATLPKDYAGVPRDVPPLGAPLPGDLGRPIVAAQEAGQAVPVPGIGTPATSGATAAQVDPEVQRRQQVVEAARLSKLFTGTSSAQVAAEGPDAATGEAANTSARPTPPSAVSASPPGADTHQSGQEHKLAFVNGPADKAMASADRLEAPVSPYVVQAGTVIPAALVTGIRSDLPGQISAQVTENVYDSPTGRYLLIPQASRLIGAYDSQIQFGQSRVLLVWTRLILPNGQSVVLERQSAADPQGYSGMQDRVDNHRGQLFQAALLSTLLSVGSEAGASDSENSLVQAIREGASKSISQTGGQIVQRELDVQPTLMVRPGFPVRVIVSRDLVLAPYGG